MNIIVSLLQTARKLTERKALVARRHFFRLAPTDVAAIMLESEIRSCEGVAEESRSLTRDFARNQDLGFKAGDTRVMACALF